MSPEKSTSRRTQRCQFFVGFRLVPHHLAQICQYPFNGIPHGVELRILERVGEVQVDRNIAATDIQRPIWVADFEPTPKLVHVSLFVLQPDGSPYTSTKSARVAAYSYNPFQKLRRSEILLPTYRNSFKVLPSATFHTVHPLTCLSSPVSSILARRNAPDGLSNISPLAKRMRWSSVTVAAAVTPA